MRERSMRVFSWHCERAYARQGLGLAECDLFLVQLLSVAGMITVAHYTGLGLVHVFLRNEGERINGTKLGCFCVVVAAAGGMGSQLLFYKSRPKLYRRRLALAASALYPIFICINVILNSSSGRSSPAALLDAALLSFVGSHCFLHRVFVRALANLLPCFSWHFCKRQFNSLTEARGSNLTHLLIASAIYIVSFIASCHFQVHLSTHTRTHAHMHTRLCVPCRIFLARSLSLALTLPHVGSSQLENRQEACKTSGVTAS